MNADWRSLTLGSLRFLGLGAFGTALAEVPEVIAVETQPLAANARRLIDAIEALGRPLPADVAAGVARAGDAKEIQRLLDPHVLLVVSLNPESRVKVARGPGPAVLQQAGYTPVVVKVLNASTVTKPLRIGSPQSGPVYAGSAALSLSRQDQLALRDDENVSRSKERFLQAEMFADPPMTAALSGLSVEVSGFGSQALGHVCLLGLKDQTYPGSGGTSNGWPTWTTPVLRWAKAQGAVAGYAHSASGLDVNVSAASARLIAQLDRDGDGVLDPKEASAGLLPEDFAKADADRDGVLTPADLEGSHRRAVDRLPNFAIPDMNGVGAQEICVTVAQGLCDFISAMDTPRIAEWNCWYHLLNCGFPLKASGETDFPCMSGTRVGQGRSYVQLGNRDSLDFAAWCKGIAAGRSYVSDGYAHALAFTVDGQSPGSRVMLSKAANVSVHAKVTFGAETPLGVPYGGVIPPAGRRLVGDTVNFHVPGRTEAPERN